jgi:hypothetical protein
MMLGVLWIFVWTIKNTMAQQRTVRYYISNDNQVRLDPVADLFLKPETIETNATLFPSAIAGNTPNLEYSVRSVPDNTHLFTSISGLNILAQPLFLFQAQMDNDASKQSEIWYQRQGNIFSSGRVLKKPFNFEFTNELKRGNAFGGPNCYFATKLLTKEVVLCRVREGTTAFWYWAIFSDGDLATETKELAKTLFIPHPSYMPSFQMGSLQIKTEFIVILDLDSAGNGYVLIAGPATTVVNDPQKLFRLRLFIKTVDIPSTESVQTIVSISTYSKATLGLSGFIMVARKIPSAQPGATPSNVGNVLFKDDELVGFLNSGTPIPKISWNGGSRAFFWMCIHGESGVNTLAMAANLETYGVSYNLFQMPGTEIPTTPTDFRTIATFQASLAIFGTAHCRFTHNLRNRIVTACWSTSYLKSDVCFMVDIFRVRPNESYQTSLVFLKRLYGAFTSYGFDIDADSVNQTSIVRMIATTTDPEPGTFFLQFKNHFIFSYLLSNDWYSVDFSRVLDTAKKVTNVDISPILNTSYPYQILIQNVTGSSTVATLLPRMTKPIVNFLRNELVQLDFLTERNFMGEIQQLATKSPQYKNIVAKINRIALGPQEIIVGDFLITFAEKSSVHFYTLKPIYLKISDPFSFEPGEVIGEFGASTNAEKTIMRNWNYANLQKAVMMENSIYLYFREPDVSPPGMVYGAFRISTWRNDPNRNEIWTPVNRLNELFFFETRERIIRIELDSNLKRRVLIFVSTSKSFSTFPSQPSHFIDLPGVMRSINDISLKQLPLLGRFQISLLYTHNMNMTGTTSNTFMVVEKHNFDRTSRELRMRYVIERTIELKPTLSYKTCIFDDSAVLSTFDTSTNTSNTQVFSVTHGSSYSLDPGSNDNRLYCDQDYVIVVSNITPLNPSNSNTITLYRLGMATKSIQRKIHTDLNASFKEADFKYTANQAFLSYKHLAGSMTSPGSPSCRSEDTGTTSQIDSDKTISSNDRNASGRRRQ